MSPIARRVLRLAASAVAVLAVAAGAGSLGCQGFGGTEVAGGNQGPPAAPVQHTLLQNVPLPVGFQMVADRSVARQSGASRVALCEFEGTSSPEEVTRFYVNYMPSAQFTLKKRDYVHGEYQLRFESDIEECIIRIKPAKLGKKTALVVDIGPLPQGSAEHESRPALRQP